MQGRNSPSTRTALLALLALSLLTTGGRALAQPPVASSSAVMREQIAAARRAARDRTLAPAEREAWQERVLALVAGAREQASNRAASAEDGPWRRIPSPAQRLSHSMIHDPERNRMVMFGGYDWWAGIRYDDVWALTLDGSPTWSLIDAEGTPGERRGHSAVYDPIGERMVVFGGMGDQGRLGDVWGLSLGVSPTWSAIEAQGTPPSARYGHTAIYDPVENRMVVFGGSGAAGSLNDVWALSLDASPTWSELAPEGTLPAARSKHVAIYDPAGARMVVFGGTSPDTWELSLGATPTWTALLPGGTPPSSCYADAAIHDPTRDRMLIFGGIEDGMPSHGVWALSLGAAPAWTTLTPGGSPPAERANHGAIYDPAGDRMVVFGGEDFDFIPLQDVWELPLDDSPAWAEVDPAGAPPGERHDHVAIYDGARGRMLVHGGRSEGYGGVDGDVWALGLDGPSSWSRLAATGTAPGALHAHSAILDPVRDRLVTFGGSPAAGGVVDQVWTLSLAGAPAWSLLAPAGTPPSARRGHKAVYDSVRDRMLVLGGGPGGSSFDLGDVWALSLGDTPAWTQLAIAGTPPPLRHDHTAIYDPVRDRIVVFGGSGGPSDTPLLNDVWALSLDGTPSWTNLMPAGDPPSARLGHSAVYDPVDDRMVVFGGGPDRNDVWALSLANPAWSELAPGGSPPRWRGRHTAIYDQARHGMVVFGGGDLDLVSLNDAWNLELATPTLGPPPSPLPEIAVLYRPRPHPIRPGGRITFALAHATQVQLRLYDLGGRLLEVLAEGPMPAGDHEVPWTGSDLSPGVYYLEMRAGEARQGQRLVVLR